MSDQPSFFSIYSRMIRQVDESLETPFIECSRVEETEIPMLSELFSQFSRQKIAHPSAFDTYLKQSTNIKWSEEIKVEESPQFLPDSPLEEECEDEIFAYNWSQIPESVKHFVEAFDACGGSLFGCNLSETLIKKQFRKLAFKTHPDYNPESERGESSIEFYQLKKSYDDLITAFLDWQNHLT